MGSIKEYFSSVGQGVKSLLVGMGVTGKEFVTPKITEQYPENRKTLHISERFRAELTLKYDAEGRHRCIACGICQMNCPNGTISLTTKMVELPDGKKKRQRCRRSVNSTSIRMIWAVAHSACSVSPHVLRTHWNFPMISSRLYSHATLLSNS